MKQENRDFLNANRHHWDTWQRIQMVQHLDGNTRETMLRVIREEFAPGYSGSTWCQQCVIDMLTYVYTQYDKLLAREAEERKVAMTFPVNDPPDNAASLEARTMEEAIKDEPKKNHRRR